MPTQGWPPPSDASVFLASLSPPPPPGACSLLSRTPSRPWGHPGGFHSNHGLLPAPAHPPPPPSSGRCCRQLAATPSHNLQVGALCVPSHPPPQVGCKRHEKQSLAPPVIGVNPLEDGGVGWGKRILSFAFAEVGLSLLLGIQVAFNLLRLIFSLQRLRSYLVPISPKLGILQRC